MREKVLGQPAEIAEFLFKLLEPDSFSRLSATEALNAMARYGLVPAAKQQRDGGGGEGADDDDAWGLGGRSPLRMLLVAAATRLICFRCGRCRLAEEARSPACFSLRRRRRWV